MEGEREGIIALLHSVIIFPQKMKEVVITLNIIYKVKKQVYIKRFFKTLLVSVAVMSFVSLEKINLIGRR